MQKRYILSHLRRKLERRGLSEEDRKTLAELTDPKSPNFALNRGDLHFLLSVSTIHYGKVAA